MLLLPGWLLASSELSLPHFYSKVWCTSFHMKANCCSHANKTNCCGPGLVMKKRSGPSEMAYFVLQTTSNNNNSNSNNISFEMVCVKPLLFCFNFLAAFVSSIHLLHFFSCLLSLYRMGQLLEYFAENDSQQQQKENQDSLR